ncbi:unnamed protein product [Caenorhabditis auriculariae]|uniref:glucuronosyltransferase n=1 Tax=Caenorhabditis auriculariae TaxID=2777116 RepID=A0A8S1HDG7_9PELO|nr:unnamed protein product [Caenorhabditis auriculariae]
MPKMFPRWLFLIFLITPTIVSLDVVVFLMVIGKSHFHFVSSLIESLNERGHNVDVIFARLNDGVIGNGSLKFRRSFEISFETPGYYRKNTAHLEEIFIEEPKKIVDLQNYTRLAYELCECGLKKGGVMEFLREGKYEIGLTNDYDSCGPLLLKHANVPSIVTFTPTPLFPNQRISAGLPTPASVFLSPLSPETDGGIWDRLFHLFKSAYYLHVVYSEDANRMNDLGRRFFGEGFIPIERINREISLIFVNSNEIVEKAVPISSKIRYIGGIGKTNSKPLNKEFDEILSISSTGTVIFSFGTQVATAAIPFSIRQNFVRAFQEFPDVTFLWKYDVTEDDSKLFEGVKNVHLKSWLPQTDILHDERVIGFVSHMGLNSFLETSAAGVPTLAIPLFVDQRHNALNAAERGTSIIVKKHELTFEKIKIALEKLIRDPSYKRNAKRVASMIKTKPNSGKESFIEWFEFAAANPELHQIFDLPGSNMSIFFYYCIDIALVFFASLHSHTAHRIENLQDNQETF